MPRATTDSWETAIAEVHHDDVNIRGEWLTGLIAKASFAEVAYLVLTGARATPGQATGARCAVHLLRRPRHLAL